MYHRFSLFLILFSAYQLGYGQKIGIKDTIYITQCDTGSEGKMVFNLETIKNSVFSSSQSIVSPTIFISTQGGSVIKIIDVLTNPTIQNVCQGISQNWTDIAINKDRQIYLCTNSAIYKLDSSNCTVQLFYQSSSSNIVALSFDTKNNLYFSEGTVVYRFNNTTGSPVVWHDFGAGYSSGDFVMKNGKMYIAWVISGQVRLYEVSVDNNINFVSYTYNCVLKTKTYGLASELGQLYGVTPGELYRIDDKTCQYSTIKVNTGLSWYGAAGLHEAQNAITAHLNYSDAVAITNPIQGLWTNTIAYNQLIYLTIDDKIKDSLFIYPVKIKIKPKIHTTINKTICKGTSYAGYTTNGTYVNNFSDIDGCDSIRTLNLTVVDKIIDTLKASICQGDSYRTYNNTGIYTENYKTSNGCDSILVIDLKVNNLSYFTLNKTICQGKIFEGKTIAGTYLDTFKNSLGCDSIRTLNLAVVTISKPLVDIYKCIVLGQKIKFLSLEIYQPGIYIDSTNHIQDCDTIYRLHVSQVNPYRDTIQLTQCQGYVFKSIPLINDTLIVDTIRSLLGCDSIYRANKIHIQKLTIQGPNIVHYCDTFVFQNNTYQTDTSILEVKKYSEAPYCDSIKLRYFFKKAPKPHIRIYTPMGTYCIQGESIVLEAQGADKYLWNTLEDTSHIKITPLQSTTYFVRGWNQYNCVDSEQVDIEVEDVVNFDIPNAFSPNCDGNNDVWTPNSNGKFEILSLDVYNRWGEKVFGGNLHNYSWNGYYKGDLQPIGVYSYYLRVKKNRQIFEKKGSVTLVK